MMVDHKRKFSMPRDISKRNNSFLNKKDQYIYTNDGQHDAKSYRIIMHKFYSQLNYFGKKHKNCLGQLDLNYKFFLTKQERFFQQQNINMIFEKNIDKMKRQMLYRNTLIQRSINQYSDNYYGQFGQSIQDNKQKFQQNNFTQTQNQVFTHNIPETNRRYRPISSTGLRPKSFNNQTQSAKLRCQVRAIKNSISQSTNMDDPQVFQSQGNQCLILKRQVKKKNSSIPRKNLVYNECNKKQTRALNSSTLNKFFNKNTLSQKKSIDQESRQKVQKKLVMINTNLAISLIQSQGYKAKAKCWRPLFLNQKQNLL